VGWSIGWRKPVDDVPSPDNAAAPRSKPKPVRSKKQPVSRAKSQPKPTAKSKSKSKAQSKRKRNRKRRANATKEAKGTFSIDAVIDEIARAHSQFAADRDLLRTVAEELNLRAFHANNRQMNRDVLASIEKHRRPIVALNSDEKTASMSEPSELDSDDEESVEESVEADAKTQSEAKTDDAIASTAATIEELRAEIADLKGQMHPEATPTFFSSFRASEMPVFNHIPDEGAPDAHVEEMVSQVEQLDFKPRLNTSSYVNVVSEAAERRVALRGMAVNIADQTVYPSSFKLHNEVLNMVANLWHCPKDDEYDLYGCYPGAGTVGSTEACLLGGLALKFRWRRWYAARHPHKTAAELRAVLPNLVISSLYQAAWEKFFKYMDVEARLVFPKLREGIIDAEQAMALCDEQTIGVVCILGNHYAGQYDPVWEVDRLLTALNRRKGFQIGIHVDAASGGFIAPWQSDVEPWDFRLRNVLSISASGHKFGESVCGTGWVVWRQRRELSEHVAISVSYLGGHADSYTLNFSRPATGFYVQFYKFMRLGKAGYQNLRDNQMSNAKFIRDGLKAMQTREGKRRFLLLDAGDRKCLPVVTGMIDPHSGVAYDSVDLQHAVERSHWYVCGYKMDVHCPNTGERKALFSDADRDTTMFRVVVKSNLTRAMARDLLQAFENAVEAMDELGAGYQAMHRVATQTDRAKMRRVEQMLGERVLNRQRAGAESMRRLKRALSRKMETAHPAC